MRGLCCFLVAFSLTVSAGLVWAADYDVKPVRIESVSRSGSSLVARTVFSAKAMVPGAPVIYKAKNVTTTASTAAKLLRFGASPAGAAGIAAAAAFYTWWQANYGPLLPDGLPAAPVVPGACGPADVYYACVDYGGRSFSQAVAVYRAKVAPDRTVLQSWLVGSHGYVRIGESGGYEEDRKICDVYRSGSCPSPAEPTVPWIDGASPPESWAPYMNNGETTGGEGSLTPEEFWDGFLDSPFADDSNVGKDLLDDANGIPYDTPEMRDARQQLRDELSAQDGDAPFQWPPLPAFPPLPEDWTPEVFEPWMSEPTAGGAQAAPSTPIPVFCEWAGSLCEWLGWTQQEMTAQQNPELPIETSAPASWDSGLGSGSCPAPVVVSALGASVSLSWQPACDFVSMLRPILIAFAGVAAALILLGQRAGGAG